LTFAIRIVNQDGRKEMKSSRQEKILEIIAKQEIETQNQLIEALRAQGYNSTQATVSRDIRELRLVKELTESGGYKYALPPDSASGDYSMKLRTIFNESVREIRQAQNLVVIKTLPGLANGACAALDAREVAGLVGTLAGDDTAFLAMTDSEAARKFCEELAPRYNLGKK
jgi:transcriptional regulator of arginine metabolism